jgi:FkbM family methyltransferase
MSTVQRAINAVTKIKTSPTKQNIALKTNTIQNLIRKANGKENYLPWQNQSCIATAHFKTLTFQYYLPKGLDYNIYLNPYFHEYEITSLVHNTLTPTDTFIDVGAHAGLYTIIAAKLAKQVYSFEPNPINLKHLKENISLNRLKSITVIPKAISNTNGKLNLYYSKENTALSSSLQTANQQEQITVECITLDQALKQYPKNRIRILKIDTEGNDVQALEGAKETLKRTLNVIVEENSTQTRSFLEKEGFFTKTLEPSGYLSNS